MDGCYVKKKKKSLLIKVINLIEQKTALWNRDSQVIGGFYNIQSGSANVFV